MLSGSKLWILAMLTSSVLSLPTSTAAVERHDLVKRGKKFAACFTLKEKEELPGEAEGLPDDLYGCGGLQALQKFRGSGVPYIYIPQAVFDDPENNACDRWVTISDSKGGALSGMIVGAKIQKQTDKTCTGATGSALVGISAINGTAEAIDWQTFGVASDGPVAALEYEFI